MNTDRPKRLPSQDSTMSFATAAGPSESVEELGTTLLQPLSSARHVETRRDSRFDASLATVSTIPPPKVVIPPLFDSPVATPVSLITPLPSLVVVPPRRDTARSTDGNTPRTHYIAIGDPISTDDPPRSGRISEFERAFHPMSSVMHTESGTEMDRTVSIEKGIHGGKTAEQRLSRTVQHADQEMKKYAKRAKWTGYTLNAAIGLQIVLGTLTTALSVVTTGKQTATMTAVLGGFSTIVAAYLARARGSGEPELSTSRVKDLEQFIRECESFLLDHGHISGSLVDSELEDKRRRFEELLGNTTETGKLVSMA